jgi:uncharacterized protein with FMN-binding domain
VRRAVIATVATAAGLVLLLGYKAGPPGKASKVAVAGGASSTTVPAGTTSTSGGTDGAPSTTAGAGTYAGQLVDYMYGNIEVAVTIKGSRVSNVSVVQNNATDFQSQAIDEQAVPVLEQEALSAQGVNIDVVSGATYTSDAFAQSLQSALQKAGK